MVRLARLTANNPCPALYSQVFNSRAAPSYKITLVQFSTFNIEKIKLFGMSLTSAFSNLPQATSIHDNVQSLTSVARLTTLSQAIQEKTKLLTKSLSQKGIDAPSFEIEGSSGFPLEKLDLEDKLVRDEIINLSQKLHDLLVGPQDTLKNLAWNVSQVSIESLQYLTRL